MRCLSFLARLGRKLWSMRCHEFWAAYSECEIDPARQLENPALTAHLASCAACRTDVRAMEELDAVLRNGLAAQAAMAAPRPAAVSAAVAAAVAAAGEARPARPPRLALLRRDPSLRFVPAMPMGWLRWAAAAALIAAVGLLGQGQPWGATSIYAEATATARAAAALPSATPSPTLSAGAATTPRAVSLAPVTSTPAP